MKNVTRLSISFSKDPIIFAQYIIEASISAVSDHLKMKNITYSLQHCIVQWNFLLNNFIYVKHVISIQIKRKFHIKQSAVNWLKILYQISLNKLNPCLFEPVCPHNIYQALAYLKSHKKFCKYISITKGLSSEDMFMFSDVNVEIQRENGSCSKKYLGWERN